MHRVLSCKPTFRLIICFYLFDSLQLVGDDLILLVSETGQIALRATGRYNSVKPVLSCQPMYDLRLYLPFKQYFSYIRSTGEREKLCETERLERFLPLVGVVPGTARSGGQRLIY